MTTTTTTRRRKVTPPAPVPVAAPSFFARVWAFIKSKLPTASAVLKFATVVVIPPAAGFVATFLFVRLKVLGTLGISHSQLVTYITGGAILLVTSGITFLTQHNILKGTYAPNRYDYQSEAYTKVPFRHLLP
jgi:hypothetical protein